jgi:hypothetical protein
MTDLITLFIEARDDHRAAMKAEKLRLKLKEKDHARSIDNDLGDRNRGGSHLLGARCNTGPATDQ